MSGIVLSPRARMDIEEIWSYTVDRFDAGQAEIYLRRIWAAIETVAAKPSLARSCGMVRDGTWKYPAGSHVIFFRPLADGIVVVRILHSRMDFERHL